MSENGLQPDESPDGTLPAELRRELDAVVAAVAEAERSIATGETVDLTPHQTQVAALCERLRCPSVTERPDTRQAALEALSYIAGRFDRLARTVEARLVDLNRRLEQVAPNRPAVPRRTIPDKT